jgi:hypothetical protein
MHLSHGMKDDTGHGYQQVVRSAMLPLCNLKLAVLINIHTEALALNHQMLKVNAIPQTPP